MRKVHQIRCHQLLKQNKTKMKTNIFLCGLLLLTLPLSSFIDKGPHIDLSIKPQDSVIISPRIPHRPLVNTITPTNINDSLYRVKIGYMESRNNYSAVNQYGYLGKYQFSKKTLKGLGFDSILIAQFVDSTHLQEIAMTKLISHNLKIIKNYGLMQYVGKDVGGVTVTLEGMLAGAHLCGPNAVKQYLTSGGEDNKKDAYNTSVRKYMRQFT
jgi:hypothetical protein